MAKETDINLFRAIEVFMAVAEMRQVTAAATALGMTQSAASQHLRNLEKAFGVTLLDRSQRPIGVTHSGEVMQRHGYRLLNEIEDMKSNLRHLKSAALPVLRMGLLASIATTLTPGLFDFVENQLKVPELILSAGLSSDHQTLLNARQIDLAITSDLILTSAEYDVFPILEEPFLLVLPEEYDGPIDDMDAISQRLSLVRFGVSTPVGRRTDQHLQRCRLNLPRAIEADRSSMVVAGVVTGKCFAILTPSLLIDGIAEGMKLRLAPVPFAGFKRQIQLIARRGDLGDFPYRIAQECSDIMRRNLNMRFAEIADQITYSDLG
ncbi:LysR family transcriptional regulator [Cochlodiniinecator piscidefendens]|uniref:LysR family transcriptional regulator n=1 Tax=Cochlodiniinecator piscidefendens TaxID=2715756 RepID=UPI00140E3766|nr:LysR family transcriptional regulator [Cochlodiniinecator piscidefendens]